MIWIIIPLVLLLLFYAAIGGVYWIAFYSPHKGQNDVYRLDEVTDDPAEKEKMRAMIARLDAVPFEPVEIRSSDGLTLRGRYYHAGDGAPLSIGFHGYRGTPVRDFSGGAMMSMRLGHNLLLVEERAHCGSGGHTLTMGIREKKDVLDWIAYARGRFGPGVKILLYGVSMGAATVLMAAGEDLPDSVRGVIADSPYTTPLEILKKVAVRDRRLPEKPAEWALRLAARL
ncbi:MAG: alpha/beta hydrolase, partial [Clostridia bacterium]|nr:alpha/beta hydrolase [Clostridia bacterium]